MLAEPQDFAVLVEVWDGGVLTAWPCPAGAAGFPSSLLGSRCSCRLAPQHRARPLPLLQVNMDFLYVCIVCLQLVNCIIFFYFLVLISFYTFLNTFQNSSHSSSYQLSAWHSRKFHIQNVKKAKTCLFQINSFFHNT